MSQPETATFNNTENPSFNHHFNNLKQIAEKLKNQSEPNIDELIPLVQSSVNSYQACQARLESVSQALAELLPNIENKQQA